MPIIGIGKKSPKDIGNIQGFTMLPPLSAVRYSCDLENINELKKMYIHIPRIKYKKPNKEMNINQSFMVENVVNQNYSFDNNDNLFTMENYEPTIKILGTWNKIFNLFKSSYHMTI